MESVLRRLRLKKGDGRDSEARKRLQKELFAFNPCSDHGFPSEPTALAYDPKLSLLAVGTASGAIRLYGKPGVYFSGLHKNGSAVTKMHFIPDEARIITLCADNSLHLWELNVKEGGVSVLEQVKSFEMENSKTMMVSSFCLTATGDKLALGTDGGNVHLFDMATFQLTDTTLLQDILIQNAPEDFKVSPGSIEAVLQHPTASDQFLIGFTRGLVVLWDVSVSKAQHTYYAAQELESLRFSGDGSQFVSSHADGSYIIWTTNDASKPKENPNTPYGPFPCKAITSIEWKQGKTESWMMFAGGMPRASFGDRHTVSVIHGGTHVAFDFTSRVVDLIVLSDSESDCDDVDPHTLLVLTSGELVAIDLVSEGWPTHRSPYVLSVAGCAPVKCLQHVADVTESLWNKIVSAGNKQFPNVSTKDWPITGGQLDESHARQGHHLLLTGHGDGSVCFWDASLNGGMKLVYTLVTLNTVFTQETDSVAVASVPHEDEWPPFRKIGNFATSVSDSRLEVHKMVFNASTETLVVGGGSGQVVVFKFESNEDGSRDIETIAVNVKHEDFVGTGPLTVKPDVVWSSAGYQPKSVVQLAPPTACTNLAFHADSQLLAVSTTYGLAVVDLVRMQTVYVNSVTSALGTGVKVSRSRSFQKTLRDSFRQLRRHRSYDISDPKASQKTADQKENETESKPTEEKTEENLEEKPAEEKPAETAEKPTETEKLETDTLKTEVVIETAVESSKIEDVKEKTECTENKPAVTDAGEKVDEAKEDKEVPKDQEIILSEISKQEATPVEASEPVTADKPTESETVAETPVKDTKLGKEEIPITMTNVECLHFADTFVLHGQPVCTTLWAGTNSGHVYIYRLTLPDAEKRQEEDVRCTLVKEIRLKHGAPVVGMFVVDRTLHPLSTARAPEPSGTEGDAAAAAGTTAAVGGHRLVVCTQQQVKIFSLPGLKAQGKFKLSLHGNDVIFTDATLATFISKSDDAYSEADLICLTSLNKLCIFSLPHLRRQLEIDVSTVLSKTGSSETVADALTSTGGVFRFSGSELKEFSGCARPVAAYCCVQLKEGMRPVPVVEEPAPPLVEVKVEPAADVTAEEPAAVVVAEEIKPSADEPNMPVGESKTADDSVISANESLAAGDITADSIKVHVAARDESTVGDSNVVSSHKVIETTVHSVKTIGTSVSESTTTTVEEMKKVEGMMSTCTISSSTVSTTAAGDSSAVVATAETVN